MNIKSSLQKELPFINMTPLVDLLFFILAFFIMTYAFTPMKGLMVSIPAMPKGVDADALFPQIPLIVNEHGVLLFGNQGQIVDLASLPEALEQERQPYRLQGGEHPHLHLMIDRSVPYELVLKVLSLVQESGLPLRLSYAEAQ